MAKLVLLVLGRVNVSFLGLNMMAIMVLLIIIIISSFKARGLVNIDDIGPNRKMGLGKWV